MIGGAAARAVLKKLGRDVVAWNHVTHPIARRMHMIERFGVDLVLDVGANVGGFGRELRQLGYRGRIVSFEPLSSAYAALARAAASDPLWKTFNCGIGGADGTADINVAGNEQSSSMLGMLPRHLSSAPQSAYQTREAISVRSIDSILPEIAHESDTIYLKSDTQGYESEVLKGATQQLARIIGVQLELSLVPLYAGETLLAEMIGLLAARDFQLVSIEEAFSDPSTGQLLQVDGIFFQSAALNRPR